jgi:hypothetical protein
MSPFWLQSNEFERSQLLLRISYLCDTLPPFLFLFLFLSPSLPLNPFLSLSLSSPVFLRHDMPLLPTSMSPLKFLAPPPPSLPSFFLSFLTLSSLPFPFLPPPSSASALIFLVSAQDDLVGVGFNFHSQARYQGEETSYLY